MSWPADGLPRYTTASIAGYAGRGGGGKRAIGYVYDRARCYWPVLALTDRIHAVALRKTDEAAAVLNAGGELAPEQRGERPHGITK